MQEQLNEQEGVDYVRCPLCGERLRQLHQHISKTHHMDVDAFRERYPLCPLSCDEAHIINNRKSGSGSLLQDRLYDWLRLALDVRVEREYRLGPTFLDIAIPEQKAAIELDGAFFHGDGDTATQERVARYAKFKENAILTAGWAVLYVGEEELAVDTVNTVRGILRWLGADENKVPDSLNLYPDRRQTCVRCGKQLSLKQINGKKQFCSEECLYAHMREHPEEHSKCMNCGGLPTPVTYRHRRFCSDACMREYLEKNAKIVSVCRGCGKTLYQVTQEPVVFCCRECQLRYMEQHPEEYAQWRAALSRDSEYNQRRRKEGRVSFVCPNCGKEAWAHARSLRKSKSGKLFCCHECYIEYKRKHGGKTCN